MLLLSEWQNELQPYRRADPARITLWVIRRVINTFIDHTKATCVWIFFFFEEKEEKPDNKLWRPKIRSELLFCDWDNTGESVVHQEGLVLGMLARGHGRSPCLLPTWGNCISPNMLTFAGFPLAKPWCGTAGPCATAPCKGSLLHRERWHPYLLQAQQEIWNNLSKVSTAIHEANNTFSG